jgi:hypothetical protein
MRRCLRILAGGALVLTCLAMTAGAQLILNPVPTPIPPDGKPVRALYVFVPDVLDSQSAAQQLLDFCPARGINRQFLNPTFLRTASRSPTTLIDEAFLGAAHDSGIGCMRSMGIRVLCGGLGMTAFITAPGNDDGKQRRIVCGFWTCSLLQRRGRASNQRFDGVIYDVEPWVTESWGNDASLFTTRMQIGDRFLEFYDVAGGLIDSFEGAHPGQSLEIFAVSSFFLDGAEGTTVTYDSVSQSIVEHLIDLTDQVNVLSFRTAATGSNSITAIGEQEVGFAAAREKP